MGEVEQAVKLVDHAANQGPWWMFIAMLAVNFGTNWAMYKFFVGQLTDKDRIIALFAEAENRLTRAISLQNETELLRLASSPHVEDIVKFAAAKRLTKLQQEMTEDNARRR